ncbi:hypothetical protein [Streptomyces sp. NPDC088258]|uniref:hypothetical protein n=1 Tax=Streptomyces sp. NPDC088258 TaxID=3365849 RepID=UPI0038191835
MTTSQAIRDAKARWQRRRRRLIAYGQWQPFTDAHPVREHVTAIRATGMSLKNLSTATGVTVATLDHLYYGGTGYPPAHQIRTESANALLAYWPRLDDYVDAAVIDATGTRRRMQALAATGWPATATHGQIGYLAPRSVEKLRRNTQVTARVARTVRDLYPTASTGRAEDHGVTPWLAQRCRAYAASCGWTPPSTWDDDTIDDPDAIPEWTGRCGTDRGWWTHRLEQITVCSPCELAHGEWKRANAHLGKRDYMAALGRARAAASNRGPSIAADGRELLSHGVDIDTAAARIGVTRQHLQQELVRHPELADLTEAA